MPKKPVTLRTPWIAPKAEAWSGDRTHDEKNIYKTVYNTGRWRAIRNMVRQSNPICAICKTQPTHTIDHIKPIRQGGDAWAIENLQGLCKACNASKTGSQAKQGRGGKKTF